MTTNKKKSQILGEFENENEISLWREAESMRQMAFITIFVAATACMIGIVAVPMLYGYLQKVQSVLQSETDYCKSATGTLRQQLTRTQIWVGIEVERMPNSFDSAIHMDRFKRQTNYDSEIYDARNQEASSKGKLNSEFGSRGAAVDRGSFSSGFEEVHAASSSSSKSCGCGTSTGPAGPPGSPGTDGQDGHDGNPGTDGQPGSDAGENQFSNKEKFCFNCEVSPPGPVGNPGPKGSPGAPGQPGASGQLGIGGGAGPAGPPGPAGLNGNPGQSGAPGQPGKLVEVPGQAGPAGPPGPPGASGQNGNLGVPGNPGQVGPPGPPGSNGNPGPNGQPGQDGQVGNAGEQGGKGACDHCPTPRTSPGY